MLDVDPHEPGARLALTSRFSSDFEDTVAITAFKWDTWEVFKTFTAKRGDSYIIFSPDANLTVSFLNSGLWIELDSRFLRLTKRRPIRKVFVVTL